MLHPPLESPVEAPMEGSLATLLRAARHRKGLTLQELADEVSCAKSYLSQLENGFRPGSGVSLALLARIEHALGLTDNQLVFPAQWEATPGPVRRELARVEAGRRAAADQLRELLACSTGPANPGLDDLHRSGRLRTLIDRIAGDETAVAPAAAAPRGCGIDAIGIAVEVPLINSVAAGYPCDFTDLGYPARIADEYVRVPDIRDADAFAARVVGDSMTPDYREGDIVVFSPARDIKDGTDCFVRIEPDHESTFKRIYFEENAPQAEPLAPQVSESGQYIRLQPLNPRYPAMVLPRERVAGLYAAVSVTRMV